MWLPGSTLEEPGIEEVARIVAQQANPRFVVTLLTATDRV